MTTFRKSSGLPEKDTLLLALKAQYFEILTIVASCCLKLNDAPKLYFTVIIIAWSLFFFFMALYKFAFSTSIF